MADGKTHEKVGGIIGLGLSIIVLIIIPGYYGIALLIGNLLGNYWLSPDLDVKNPFKCRSYWRWHKINLGWYWKLYSRTIPYHRHWLSHSIIISTVYRIFWLLTPLIIIALYLKIPIFDIMKENEIILVYVYIGTEIATIVHLALDKKL